MSTNDDIVKKAIDFFISLFKSEGTKLISKAQDPVEFKVTTPERPIPVAKVQSPTSIDWSNPTCKVSKYFTVKEALTLNEWKRMASESDGLDDVVKKNLLSIFKKMDVIRELLGVPVNVRSAFRPSAYNVAIGGAAKSAHMACEDYAAVDFWCDLDGNGTKDGVDCDKIKEKLMPHLEEWGVRMEDNGQGARWVHVDNKPLAPGGHRFFKP